MGTEISLQAFAVLLANPLFLQVEPRETQDHEFTSCGSCSLHEIEKNPLDNPKHHLFL